VDCDITEGRLRRISGVLVPLEEVRGPIDTRLDIFRSRNSHRQTFDGGHLIDNGREVEGLLRVVRAVNVSPPGIGVEGIRSRRDTLGEASPDVSYI
jgi:hypothetical protein